jgi:hypothetical protein
MPKYGFEWVDGEDENEGDRWIQISELDEDDCLGEEIAVIMLRDADKAEKLFRGITAHKEAAAKMIVDALNAKGGD